MRPPDKRIGPAGNRTDTNNDDTLSLEQGTDSTLQVALGHAGCGWYVFPLKPGGKTPATRHGLLDASTDKQQIVAWFSGTSCNIGVATGPSNLVVIDVDNHDLFESWRDGRPLPDTHTVTTGKGKHYYYSAPTGKTVKSTQTRHGHDVRAWGGYVVAAGSTHESGRPYTVVDPSAEVVPLPAWLENELGEASSWTNPDQNALTTVGIPAGQPQDPVLRDLVFKWCTGGLDKAASYAAWCTVVNKTPLTRPSQPWTAVDFDRHWAGAVKNSNPVTVLPAPAGSSLTTARQLRRRSLQQVDITRTEYLWQDYLPAAELTVIAGKPGIGKSTIAADRAAQITTGALPGDHYGKPARVLYSLTEDSEAMFKARFVAAGGNPALLELVDVAYGDAGGSPLLVTADLDQLRAAVEDFDPALLVLDALNSSISGQHNDNANVRPQLESLKALAHDTQTAVLGVAHFRKNAVGVEPLDAIGGAGAYGQVVRQALGCARDDDTGSYVVSVIKSNVGTQEVDSLGYGIESTVVSDSSGAEVNIGRVTWTGTSDTDVRSLLQQVPTGDDERTERDEAADWLISYLVDHGGEAPSRDVKKAGRAEGISERTLKRAKSTARVGHYSTPTTPRMTYWIHPEFQLGQPPPKSGQDHPERTPVAQLAQGGPTKQIRGVQRPEDRQIPQLGQTQECGPTGPGEAKYAGPDCSPCQRSWVFTSGLCPVHMGAQ